MSPIGTKMNGTTVLRTALKVYWELQDKESFIETQHLSISSHIGGDFNLSSTRVCVYIINSNEILNYLTYSTLSVNNSPLEHIKIIQR